MDALGNFLVGFLGLCGWVGVGELVYTFYTLLPTSAEGLALESSCYICDIGMSQHLRV